MPFGTQSEHSKSMRDRLSVIDPEISTELGTFARKLIDVAAEELAQVALDAQVGSYVFDINAYAGDDLDAFVQLFGFSRQEAIPASGVVTLSRYDASVDVYITPGIQFYRPESGSSQAILFQAMSFMSMDSGETSIDIPVRAVVEGTTGNVPAGSVTECAVSIDSSSVTNILSMSGGRDQETDLALRERFIKTVFRNVAGTRDQYLGLALAHAFVTRANLVGQMSMYTEMLTMGGSTTQQAASTNTECADALDVVNAVWVRDAETGAYYVQGTDFTVSSAHPPVVLGVAPTITEEHVFLTATDAVELAMKTAGYAVKAVTTVQEIGGDATVFGVSTDYTVSIANGTVTRVGGGGISAGQEVHITYDYYRIPDDTVILFDYEYLSTLNRGVGRNVELFVDGSDPVSVTEERYLSGEYEFDNAGGALDKDNWVRDDGVTHPTYTATANYFEPLTYQPVVSLPATIEFAGGLVMYEGTDYWLVKDITAMGDSVKGKYGIEWLASSVTDHVLIGQPYTIDYIYNRVVGAVQALVDKSAPVTVSALVHQAHSRYFTFNLDVMYSMFPKSSVDSFIETDLTTYCNGVPFGSVMQISDIEAIVHAVSGVDSVRVTNIVEYAADGTTVLDTFTADIRLGGSDIPVLRSLVATSKTQEVW
jgi:uncharacterized phage protein gp47/JayE